MQSKYGFRFTPLALRDIDEALSYIADTLANGQAAEKLFQDIEKAIDTVCEFPFSSADCKIFLVQDENIRHIPVGNFILVYEVKEVEKQINILRFRYTRMNLTKIKLDQ